jgi:hypothetical protein
LACAACGALVVEAWVDVGLACNSGVVGWTLANEAVLNLNYSLFIEKRGFRRKKNQSSIKLFFLLGPLVEHVPPLRHGELAQTFINNSQ